jgi:ribonuclease T1
MRLPRGRTQWLTLLVTVVVALLGWWLQQGGDGPSSSRDDERRTPSPSASAPVTPGERSSDVAEETDPDSGLPVVELQELPPEAEDTVELIEAGGPFPEDRDGIVFENREEILPDEELGYYHEYTVPTPGSDDRGARRIVTGDEGEYYWTADHYDSFALIAR